MIFNTIYRRERRVSSRSCRMPVVIALFDAVMAIMVLMNMAIAVDHARETSVIDYDAFLNIFVVMAMAEFVFMMVMAPAFSSGSISNEAERKTLDMMLTTKLRASDIVTGKLVWSLSSAMLVIASSLPILAILFVYGYVRIQKLAIFVLTMFVMEIYVGSLGILASAAVSRTAVATAVSYGALLFLTCGTSLLCTVAANVAGTQTGMTGLLYLNPLTPFVAFLGSVQRTAGSMDALWAMMGFSGDADMNAIAVRAVAVQLMASAGFVVLAVRCISPQRRK